MSRVGKKPILIPSGVDVTISGQIVTVKGPKGELQTAINTAVTVSVVGTEAGKEVVFTVETEDDKNTRAQWGTARANVANLIKGVTERFSKKLEINGVGYRVSLNGRKLVLILGYSHEVPFVLPDGIDATVEGNIITIIGADKHLVGEVADQIRRVRPPEPYKGKGVKYSTETIRRKAGKAQKAGE